MLVIILFPQYNGHVLNALYLNLTQNHRRVFLINLNLYLKEGIKVKQSKTKTIPAAFGYWVRSQTQISIWILIK